MTAMTEQESSTVSDQTDNTATPDEGDKSKAGSEAAKYRVRAKQAEARVEELAQRVARLQQAEVDRLASAQLSDPDDLRVFGTTVADLVNEAGDLDPALVEAAVEALLERKPTLARGYVGDVDGFDGGSRQGVSKSSASWSSVLSGREQR